LGFIAEKVREAAEEAGEAHAVEALSVLVVHAHSSCNCKCVMCDIWKTKTGKAFQARDLEPHLVSIRRLGVRWVVFSGGEPLLNPELPVLCAMLRKEKIRLTLLTTGLLLEKKAEEVAASFDDVIVSLDGPPAIHDAIRRVAGAFAKVEDGVEALRELREDLQITARTVVQKANHCNLRETKRAAKEMGLNAISFLAADLTSTAFNRALVWPVERQGEVGLSVTELGELESEIELLIEEIVREGNPSFVQETPEKLRRIARQFRVQLGLERAESPMCNAPWVSAVIETDGAVRPCFFHRAIGNLHKGSLEAIINGKESREFRTKLDVATNAICQRCVCSLHYRG